MKINIRTLFISDVHLGNPNCQSDKLLHILKLYDFQNLIIVGDFIDMTYMKRKFNWKSSHSLVIQKVLKLSRNGTSVTYILGNHDFYVRSVLQNGTINFGNIQICDELVYESKKGEKIFITHGDCFDGFIKLHPILYVIGDRAYEFSIKVNKLWNWFRIIFGYKYWSLSAFLKSKVKNAVKFLTEYKKMSIEKTKSMGCHSIIIGHTHTPEILPGKYYNCGDWVESCSYLIENNLGNIELKFYDQNLDIL